MSDLKSKAMLIRLSISQWTARKLDRKVTKEIEAKYNAHDAGRYNKVLIALEEIKKIQKIANEARTFHYFNTLPWADNGDRILPSKNYFNYTQKMGELKQKFENAVSDFLNNYDALKQEAKTRLNGLYNEADYPDKSEIKYKYGFEVIVNPVPTSEDFRITLNDSETERIKQEIENRLKTAETKAIKDLYQRFYEALNHLVNRLSEEDAVFRDSIINNIAELVQILPRLNVTNDPDLNRLSKEIEQKLLNVTADDLRKFPKIKQDTKESAEQILNKLSGYIGG